MLITRPVFSASHVLCKSVLERFAAGSSSQGEYAMKMFANISKGVFFPSLFVMATIILFLYFLPVKSSEIIDVLFDFCTQDAGWLYIIACLASFIFLIVFSSSKYAKIRLGKKTDRPQFSNFSWASMLFTAGVGTSIIILGFLEPIYYVTDPPYGLEPFSPLAFDYAHMFGQFHWGLSAWAFYNPVIIAIAYMTFVRQEKRVSLGSVCTQFMHGRFKDFLSTIIDISVVFGIVASISTSLGLATPIMAQAIQSVFGLSAEYEFALKVFIILIWMCIFGSSVYLGLEKGIRNLSNINVLCAALFMAIIFIFTPFDRLFQMEFTSLKLYVTEFISHNVWDNPFKKDKFVESWTIFYWGWWISFTPMMGIFVAKISRGRTIRNVIWGQLLWGSLGCALCFMIFGGYSLYLQQTGIVDLAHILKTDGQGSAIMAIMHTLPYTKWITLLLCFVCFLYLATTIDSCAYVLASVTTKELEPDEEPARWNRVLWAVVFSALSIGLLIIGGLRAIQTVSIVAGLPLIFVLIAIMFLCKKMFDRQ